MTALLRFAETPASTASTRQAVSFSHENDLFPTARSGRREPGAVLPELLSQVSFLASLGAEDLTALADACQTRTFKPGQALFYEGDPGHALFLIRAGQVKIVGVAGNGQELLLNVYGPGEYLGELALLDDAPRSATATALDRVEALLLYREDFLALIERRPLAARAVMGRLAQMVRRLNEQVQDVIGLDVPGRIAKTLLGLAERQGKVTPEGIRIALPLTREEFAQLVGAARTTVSTVMSGFRERGILSVDREGITLHEPDRLRGRVY
jgi:CRP/FNR family cyclic AMP-dependent transcriptional regulator